jgi:hypothetical protein
MEGEMKHRCAHVVLSTILRAGLLREGQPYRINLYDAVRRLRCSSGRQRSTLS